MRIPLREPRCWAIAASLACYVTALFSPALLFEHNPPVRGITALLWGWWGIVKGDFPWFANPIYFAAVVLAWQGLMLLAIPLSAAAIVVGWRSVDVKEWFFNEAGGTPIAGLGIGFYLWIASFAVLMVGAAVVKWLVRSRTKPAG